MALATLDIAAVPLDRGAAGRTRENPHPVTSEYRHRAKVLRRRAILVDALAIYVALFAAFTIRFGVGEFLEPGLEDSFALTALALMPLWLAALSIADSWNIKWMGTGRGEYARVINATLYAFGAAAIISYLAGWSMGRAFVAVALPTGVLVLCLGRRSLRAITCRERRAGVGCARTLVIGDGNHATEMAEELRCTPEAGLHPVAVCPVGSAPDPDSSYDLVDSLPAVPGYIATHHIDAVIASSGSDLTAAMIKHLAWELEDAGVEFLIEPGLFDVAARRLSKRPIAKLSLLDIAEPGYTSAQQAIKRVFDLVGSALLIVLFALPLALSALLIKVTSPGPVLFKQTRIGLRGEPFRVYKFRSMCVDAEAKLASLVGADAGVYYKLTQDPRITPVGRVLRRYSIDELPQLFNVLFGHMSLVGPRPLTPHGQDLARAEIFRRLLVAPGMTGLWQVSGRNNLDVEQAIRLDLYYVENWSLVEDLLILARTAKAVLGRDGAY